MAPRSGGYQALIGDASFELIPLKSFPDAVEQLPANSDVSVTASPNQPLEATLDASDLVAAAGHHAVPHISARLVHSKAHLGELLDRAADAQFDEIFLVGGDAPEPAGPYDSAVQLLEDLLVAQHGINHIGITSYPDGHALISSDSLRDALHTKQRMLAEAGISAHASTQMCFSAPTISKWLRAERAAGFTLPVRLGIPGAVDRARLLRIGTRLGVGASLRYLRKNRGMIRRMMSPGGYDPNQMLGRIAPDAEQLGVGGLHVFTFNAVAETIAWMEAAKQSAT